MEFDRFTVALLVLRGDAPPLDDSAATALQDAHLAHLADLYEAGVLLAVGPLGDPELRGLAVLAVAPEEARAVLERDPAVVAGRFAVRVLSWAVPSGAVGFTPTRFPRSTAEAEADS